MPRAGLGADDTAENKTDTSHHLTRLPPSGRGLWVERGRESEVRMTEMCILNRCWKEGHQR